MIAFLKILMICCFKDFMNKDEICFCWFSFRNFNKAFEYGSIKPLKKERKSSFNQLAGARKHECKILTEYLIGLYERDYELNEVVYE